MAAYKIPPDLREWCRATAPTLDRHDWGDCARLVRSRHEGAWLSGPGVLVTPDQARALLAYADEVAAGLTASDVTAIRLPRYASPRHFKDLRDRKLVAGMQATDWGRYIAGRAAALRGGA